MHFDDDDVPYYHSRARDFGGETSSRGKYFGEVSYYSERRQVPPEFDPASMIPRDVEMASRASSSRGQHYLDSISSVDSASEMQRRLEASHGLTLLAADNCVPPILSNITSLPSESTGNPASGN